MDVYIMYSLLLKLMLCIIGGFSYTRSVSKVVEIEGVSVQCQRNIASTISKVNYT